MQQSEKELDIPVAPTPTEPIRASLHLTAEEADEIFKLAEAEIQPLLRQAAREKWTGRVQAAFCLCLMLAGVVGSVYGVINYPKTTVTLFPVERPVTITTALPLPLRTLAPVTVTRTASAGTTGHGHQNARAATGSLTFYNGNVNPQTVARGTVFTGADGIQISIDQSGTIPAANPPSFGQTTITATTVQAGSAGNIHAYYVNGTVSSSLFVKNLEAFTGGRDARDYQAVAQQDIQSVTTSTTQKVNQQIPQAFTLRPGEALKITDCTTKSAADHTAGEEAQSVTLTTLKTCAAVAYNSQQLDNQAMVRFTSKARPTTQYQRIGEIKTSVISITPFIVTVSGVWVITITSTYEQYLAEHLAGDTPAKAKKYLLSTGVIAQARIPAPLPDAMYIQFSVLVEL